MPRLIWVFVGRTCHLVDVVSWLILRGGYTFKGGSTFKMFLSPFRKKGLIYKSQWDMVCRKANRKAQRMSPLWKGRNLPGVLYTLNYWNVPVWFRIAIAVGRNRTVILCCKQCIVYWHLTISVKIYWINDRQCLVPVIASYHIAWKRWIIHKVMSVWWRLVPSAQDDP